MPNYAKLDNSKFGGKYNKGGTGREKNKNRVRLVKQLILLTYTVLYRRYMTRYIILHGISYTDNEPFYRD